MKTNQKFEIVFDNAGRATLQVGDKYTHYYDNMSSLASDVEKIVKGEDVSDWEGNDPGIRITEAELSKPHAGGYRVITPKSPAIRRPLWRSVRWTDVLCFAWHRKTLDNDISCATLKPLTTRQEKQNDRLRNCPQRLPCRFRKV